MDRVGLTVLRREVAADCKIASDAFKQARQRLEGTEIRDLEAAAFQLVRCYNALEQAALRVAKAFENNIDDDAGWHAEVMRRLTLDLPEIRPAVFSEVDLAPLRELRGFRHMIVHAYDLILDHSRMQALLERAGALFKHLESRYAVSLMLPFATQRRNLGSQTSDSDSDSVHFETAGWHRHIRCAFPS